ncbi:MAG: FAD-binding oxidoreductase [Streptomyces sp.]|nr:FAD-binding oxidoreductase [Streptomyces sp.]
MSTLITDGSRTYAASAAALARPRDAGEVRDVLARARRSGTPVCISGGGYNQGGLNLADGAVQIGTEGLDRILDIDVAARTARVQAGVTWDALREALDPLGLSPRVTQSYGVFTVGGSVSINAHGRNIDTGVLAATVVSLRVVLADGEVVDADRDRDPDVFRLVLGGLGLVGVLLDVTIELTENHEYRKSRVAVMPTEEYPRCLADVTSDKGVHFHYARLAVTPSELWEKLLCVDYRVIPGGRSSEAVRSEPLSRADLLKQRGLFLGCTYSAWMREHRFGWEVQHRARMETVRRNNVAKESIQALRIPRKRSGYWLQEFFLPAARITEFLDAGREVLRAESFQLLNTTMRFVPRNTDAFLSYAAEDRVAAVVYFRQPLDGAAIARTVRVMRRLLDCALGAGGTYYLSYHRYASGEQLRRAYPAIDDFFRYKRKLDPDGTFSNQFWTQYAGEDGDAARSAPAAR